MKLNFVLSFRGTSLFYTFGVTECSSNLLLRCEDPPHDLQRGDDHRPLIGSEGAEHFGQPGIGMAPCGLKSGLAQVGDSEDDSAAIVQVLFPHDKLALDQSIHNLGSGGECEIEMIRHLRERSSFMAGEESDGSELGLGKIGWSLIVHFADEDALYLKDRRKQFADDFVFPGC